MADNKNTPPLLRAASTVILVKEKDRTFEVYLLRRNTKSGFMGGLYVFPGGVVDSEDRGVDFWAPNIDITPDQIGKQLGASTLSSDDALSFSIAAIRGDPIAPRLVPSPNGPMILELWDPLCDSDCEIDTSDFADKVLPPGTWFSRIWCDKGIWKPVGI